MRIREGSLLERQQWFILCLRFVLQFNCTDCLLVWRRRRRLWGSIISQGVRPRTSSSVSQSELEMDGSQNGSLQRPKSKSYRFSIRQLPQEWGFLCHSLVSYRPTADCGWAVVGNDTLLACYRFSPRCSARTQCNFHYCEIFRSCGYLSFRFMELEKKHSSVQRTEKHDNSVIIQLN